MKALAMAKEKWVLVFLIVFFSGCLLDATLTSSEQAWCVNATSASASRIPFCNTLHACQEAFREQFSTGAGEMTGAWIPLGQAENAVVLGWWRTNSALQRLEKLNKLCQTGKASEIMDVSRQVASDWGAMLQASEQAQVFSLHALHAATEEASKMGLENVRDSKAFEDYARLLEMVQELKTGGNQHAWIRQLNAGRDYFSKLSGFISNQEPHAYQIDSKSGFEWLKTPIKLVDKSVRAKLVIAFFPVWQSMWSSAFTRKNASKGLQLLQELNAQELLNQVETGIGDNGTHRVILQLISDLEQHVHELENEEKENGLLASSLIFELQQTAQLEMEKKEKQYSFSEPLQKWEERASIAANKISFQPINWKIRIDELEFERAHLQEMSLKKSKTLGERIVDWRNWVKKANTLKQEISNESNALENDLMRCQRLAKAVQEKEEYSGITKLAASDVVNAKKEKMEMYCEQFLRQLEENESMESQQWAELSSETNLNSCVENVNEYMAALNIELKLSENQLMQENGSRALALNVCQSALLNAEQTYLNHPAQRDWQGIMNELRALKKALERIAFIKGNGNDELVGELSRAERVRVIFSLDELEKEQEKMQALKSRAQARITEEIQLMATATPWEVVSPELILADGEVNAQWKWEFSNPVAVVLDFPMEIAIPIHVEMNGFSSNEEWEEQEDLILIQLPEFSLESVWVSASSTGKIIETHVEMKVDNVIGNLARMHAAVKAESQAAGINGKFEYVLPDGVVSSTISILNQNDFLPFVQEQHLLKWQTRMEHLLETFDIYFEQNGIIEMETKLISQQAQNETTLTKYEITWKNALPESVRFSAGTGIVLNPVEIISSGVMDERGIPVDFEETPTRELVIKNQEIDSHGTRIFIVLLVTGSGIEVWQSMRAVLLQQIESLEESEFELIKTRAWSLKQKVIRAETVDKVEELAKLLPQWQLELDAIAYDEAVLHIQKGILEKRLRALESKMIEPEKRVEWEKALKEWNNGNFSVVEKKIAWMESNSVESSVNNNTDTNWTMDKSAQLKSIEKISVEIEQVNDSGKHYSKALSVSCKQLAETGYICPLSENHLRDWQGELDKIKKELREKQKAIAKIQTEKEWNELTDELAVISLRTRVGELQVVVDEALRALKEGASQVVKSVELESDSSEEWKESKQKMNQAFENNEYGKAIYIGRNLLQFAKQSAATGFAFLPEKTFPLLGIALLAGGFGIYNWWKKKNAPEPQLKMVPKETFFTLPPIPEKEHSEPISPKMKGESPPVPQSRTK